MLKFKNVTKKYTKDSCAIDNLTMDIDHGEFVFLVGQNGAGKSTLLRLISCEERPDAGEIIFNGTNTTLIKARRIPLVRRQMGIIFQDFKLLNNLTVAENIGFALRVIGLKPQEITTRINEVLEIIEMKHKYKSYPHQLSAGEQQRTAVGRALANKPMLLLADEPTGNLDPVITDSIMDLFMEINKQGTTIVMATHDLHIVNRIKRRVIILQNGRIIRDEA